MIDMHPAADRAVARTDNMSPRERFADRVRDLVTAANAWASGRRIRSEDEAGKCQDLLDQLRKERQAVDAQRATEKKPHDEAAKDVQRVYVPLIDTLDAAAGVLSPLKAAWLRLKQLEIDEAKREAEAAAAKAREDAAAAARAAEETDGGDAIERLLAAAATAKQAEEAQLTAARAAAARPQVVGDLGGRASGFRTVWYAQVTDWEKAAAAFSSHPAMRDLIQRLANATAKASKAATRVDGVVAKSKQEV